ncbi:uncharacterized protein [Typha latifolia]|uniref:uncharacterized protein isoform X1 n=1 Tax=Typha latifolia TaxID=4733 RepID=UPI003C2B0B09
MTTGSESIKTNHLPPSLVANLQNVLMGRRGGGIGDVEDPGDPKQVEVATQIPSCSAEAEVSDSSAADGSEKKPVVLVTNAEGIDSPGLVHLVDALVRGGQCNVYVCAPESDKSLSSHSVTLETVVATSVEINGAKAFQISGTTADCVSLALSGALFSWTKPALVISGINKGSVCGHQNFYSSSVAGAREALMSGIPSLAISLDWKKDEGKESDLIHAVEVCIPLIHAAIRDIENAVFPKRCLLNIGIPSSPSTNKGFKLTRQSLFRFSPSWQAVSANRHPSAGQFMSMHQSLGVQLAQLGRDASAAGAARRINAQRKNVEIESVAAAGKPETREIVKKFFRLEFLEKEQEDVDEDLDFRALENGFIAVTPLCLHVESEIQASVSDWLCSALTGGEEAP